VSEAPEGTGRGGLPAEWAVLQVEFESASEAQFAVTGMGAKVRVLSPKELQERVRKELHAVREAMALA
jgi:predicted DNA-binding transcriptional regulator YafY